MSDWNAIVRAHGPMVFGTAWRILGHAADTEDVVQEVFLEAHQQRCGEVRSWPGYLRRLAICRALDRLRRRKRVQSLQGMQFADGSGDPEAAAIERELAERLRQAITHLSDREAAVFCLRCFEELSNTQIAEHLKISPGAVAVALHKARTKLETMLLGAAKGE